MDHGFKNPIAPKKKTGFHKYRINFKAPSYDDRNNISAGDSYGTGFRNPVGKDKARSGGVVPMGRVKTMKDDHLA
jgi:hypothetical protein